MPLSPEDKSKLGHYPFFSCIDSDPVLKDT
jgi:hypothetical protein